MLSKMPKSKKHRNMSEDFNMGGKICSLYCIHTSSEHLPGEITTVDILVKNTGLIFFDICSLLPWALFNRYLKNSCFYYKTTSPWSPSTTLVSGRQVKFQFRVNYPFKNWHVPDTLARNSSDTSQASATCC